MIQSFRLTSTEVEQRMAEVAQKTGLSIDATLSNELKSHVFGDFLTHDSVCVKAKNVVEFMKVFPYLRVTLERVEWLKQESVDTKAHPRQLIVAKLDATRRWQLLLHSVFGILWQEIVVYLPSTYEFAIAFQPFTNTSFEVIESYKVQQFHKLIQTCVRSAWIEQGRDRGMIPPFNLDNSEFSALCQRFEEHPNYFTQQSHKWATTIIKFLLFKTEETSGEGNNQENNGNNDDEGDSDNDKDDELREVLEATLEEHGLELREDSIFCQEFLNHEICCNLEEVVAVMLVTNALFRYSHVAWSTLHDEVEDELKSLALDEGMDWIPAAKQLISSKHFRSRACESSQKRYHDLSDDEEFEKSRRRARRDEWEDDDDDENSSDEDQDCWC
ncbi:hypothetical protein BCR33DRAFT_715482 [Rhizoclosmatium globosum]|uniref:Uncharacterized protein n=1 Tax=Rhizoclosmatium globosum TaxID=329046 RepID=A0A1Y2CH75_9FUNG|nr:hypothetical protein BCR33DRAFT_715482 [Rhizoclosmatium globosum]|eukprot:ORY46379.1 hypothetical protein BCR33DRAFT_715482 [Rhizoclosmatium globosum]